MWNNVFRPISTDDYDLRFFDCQIEYVQSGPRHRQIINDIQVGHYAGYDLVGRTEVEPLPIDPDFKKTGRLWLFGLYPLLAPQEARGTGLLRYRYAARRMATIPGPGIPAAAASAPSERVAQQHRDRSADFGSRSLFGLQSQDRRVQLQVPGREGDARDG